MAWGSFASGGDQEPEDHARDGFSTAAAAGLRSKVVVKKRRWKRAERHLCGAVPGHDLRVEGDEGGSIYTWTSRWWVSYGPGEGGCEESRKMRRLEDR